MRLKEDYAVQRNSVQPRNKRKPTSNTLRDLLIGPFRTSIRNNSHLCSENPSSLFWVILFLDAFQSTANPSFSTNNKLSLECFMKTLLMRVNFPNFPLFIFPELIRCTCCPSIPPLIGTLTFQKLTPP